MSVAGMQGTARPPVRYAPRKKASFPYPRHSRQDIPRAPRREEARGLANLRKEDVNQIDEQDEREDHHCRCNSTEGFALEIEDGGILVTHVKCGKQPWFMDADWVYCVYMDEVPIRVESLTSCRAGCDMRLDKTGCDCDPEVTLTMEGKSQR